ncbi:ricin B lectin domain-containing protein [Ephemerocybe angulata]|uniref:Ricin B lectin domain-containing protein n=1 Tax=Ephemerocybe angulata TaxID=980116 RepID=A0A8H6MCB3_9AGAR|nr:ricin B lectin domain-containing protein [Tulosesus angulatus]
MLRTTSYLAVIAAFFASGAIADGGWWGNNGPYQPPPPPPGPPGPPPPPPPPPPGPPGPPPPPPPPPQKPVQLHPNYNWKKCLDVQGGRFANGVPVDIFDCNGTPAQNWIINPGNTRVQVAGQNFCLDAGEWPNYGTKMKIWSCYDNLPAQNWYYTDDKRIALANKGFCLDLTNGDTSNYNVMQIWGCTNGNVNQIWST